MQDSVFILSCIQYCSYMKIDVILLFDQYLLVKQQNDTHIIWLHYGIHDKMRTRSRINCRFQIRLDSLMDKALDLGIRGRDFESRYGQEFFIL